MSGRHPPSTHHSHSHSHPHHQHPHPQSHPPDTNTSPTSSTHSTPHHSMQNISPTDLQFLRQTQRSLGLSPATSSPNPSSNSSTTGGLSLDSNALTALSTHFDGLMAAITARVQTLSEQTRASTQATHRRSSHVVDRATVEIETLRDILRQCDELETEFLKIKRLGEMVKGFRKRVETLEKKVGR